MENLINIENFDVVMLCDHCGERTVFRIRADYSYMEELGETQSSQMLRYTSSQELNRTTWYIMQCSACFKPIVTRAYKGVDENSQPVSKVEILYPAEKTPLTNLPEVIERKYVEALKVRNVSPSSCAVMVRKTLEAVCQHENAEGRVLADKLKNLANSGRIPQTLADVALHLKQLGNLGAHFDEDEVTEKDVPIILDFVELILEYLYVAPAKIEAVRKRLNRTS